MDKFWIFSLLIATIRAASLNISSTESDYYFLTHTFSNLSCDPYTKGTSTNLALECSVQGPRNSPASSFKIVWYRTSENTRITQNLNNLYSNQSKLVEIEEQKIAVSNLSDIVIVRSVLTVADLNSNNVSGKYWCSVEEEDQSKVLMSKNALAPPLLLHLSSAYQGLPECPEGFIHTAMANNPVSPSTSSPSYSITTSNPLTTTSSISTSASTIENTSNKIKKSVNYSSKMDMISVIVFSLTIGTLVFAVNVLLVIVGCMCCGGECRRSKEKKDILPFHRTANSTMSSSSLLGSDCNSPGIPSPILPITPLRPITDSGPYSPVRTILTKPPNYPPPQMKPPPPKMNLPPPEMKPPPVPLWSTLPSQLMPSCDTNDFQDNNAFRKRAATLASEMSYCYAYQTKPEILHLSDIARMSIAEKKQNHPFISPLNSKATDDIYASPIYTSHGRSPLDRISTSSGSSDPTVIIKQVTYTEPGTNLACFSFTNKYKSLIIETMDGSPIYQYPADARSSGERDEDADNEAENIRSNRNEQVKIAMEYAWLHLMNDVTSEGGGINRVSAMTDSMDGDYVLPNEVIQTAMTSPNNEELTTVEQPDYITLS